MKPVVEQRVAAQRTTPPEEQELEPANKLPAKQEDERRGRQVGPPPLPTHVVVKRVVAEATLWTCCTMLAAATSQLA